MIVNREFIQKWWINRETAQKLWIDKEHHLKLVDFKGKLPHVGENSESQGLRWNWRENL